MIAQNVEKRQISPKHLTEWQDSHPDFVLANVHTISGDEAFDYVAGDELRKAQEASNQVANSKVRSIYKNYSCVLNAEAWVAQGLNPLNGWQPCERYQIKSDDPRIKWESGENVGFIKYDMPAGPRSWAFIPNIPLSIAQIIYDRHKATAPEHALIPQASFDRMGLLMRNNPTAFWTWFKANPSLPLNISEGTKKSGAGCSAGITTISVGGMWDACMPRKSGPRLELKPEIIALGLKGRTVYLSYDEDEKDKTRRDVKKAIDRTAFLLRKHGAKPYFVNWEPSQGKGMDDFIHNNGQEAFYERLACATSYVEMKVAGQVSGQLTRIPDLVLNQQELDIPWGQIPDSGIICLDSAKGTGKTKNFLSPLAQKASNLLLVGHLINLTKANSERMGATYRTDVDRAVGHAFDQDGGKVYKFSTVINSILSYRPRDFEGATLILDEVTQLVRAMVTSDVISKARTRSPILTRFRHILQVAKLIVCADADMDDATIAYLEILRDDDEKAFLIKNEWVGNGYDVHSYEGKSPAALIRDALDCYKEQLALGAEGKHVVIACDSKEQVVAIEKLAKSLNGKTLSIHSGNSEDGEQQVFAAAPDMFLSYHEGEEPLMILYSPSLGTGTSIESDRIAHVFGVFTGGSIGDSDILQMLARVRKPVSRSVYVAERGRAYARLSQSSSPEVIREALKDETNMIALSLQSELKEDLYSGLNSISFDTDPHINMACHVYASKNKAMPELRARVLARIKAEGNTIVSQNDWDNAETKERMILARQVVDKDDATEIEAQPNISKAELAELNKKETLTKDERQQIKKYSLNEFYVTAVTAELILADKKGKRQNQIKQLEQQMDDTGKAAAKIDIDVIKAQHAWKLDYSPQDLTRNKAKWMVRDYLGLMDWVNNTGTWYSGCEALEALKAKCLSGKVPKDIKMSLGYTVTSKTSAQTILGTLLKQMGVECIRKAVKVRGKTVYQYSIDQEGLAELKAIIERRRLRAEAEAEQGLDEVVPPKEVVPPSVNKWTETGTTEAQDYPIKIPGAGQGAFLLEGAVF
jgi:hypothetical protein